MNLALVTGGKGFIGSHLVERLLRDGWAVTVVDDGRSGTTEVEGAEYIRHSVRGAGRLGWAVDAVFHLAGPVGPVGVLEHAGRIVPDIVADAQVVRDIALRCDAPLVYVSTSEVYGLQQQPMTEQAPRIIAAGHSARQEYAVAKLAAETMLLNTRGLDVRIIRPFNVAGPRQREEGGFVLPRFIRQAKAGEPLTVYTPGTQRRAFTHVVEVADAIVRAEERGRPGEVYNLGNPANECSIWELARDVCHYLRSPSVVDEVDPRDLWGPAFHEAPDKVPDITKAINELGWSPRIPRATIILDAAAAV